MTWQAWSHFAFRAGCMRVLAPGPFGQGEESHISSPHQGEWVISMTLWSKTTELALSVCDRMEECMSVYVYGTQFFVQNVFYQMSGRENRWMGPSSTILCKSVCAEMKLVTFIFGTWRFHRLPFKRVSGLNFASVLKKRLQSTFFPKLNRSFWNNLRTIK